VSSLSNSVIYYAFNGNKYVDNTGSSYGASYGNNDVIGVAIDADSGTIVFYKNNSSQGSITHSVAGLFPFFADGTGGSGTTLQVNFGQRPFAYTPQVSLHAEPPRCYDLQRRSVHGGYDVHGYGIECKHC
jgi:hypothetical protein